MEGKIIQIPLAYKTKEDLKKVVNLCQSFGYRITQSLDDIDSIKERIVAIVIDIEKKIVFQSNVTCMAAWCSCSSKPRKPLYAHEFLENYKRLLVDRDLLFYTELIEKAALDHSRPGGQLFIFKK